MQLLPCRALLFSVVIFFAVASRGQTVTSSSLNTGADTLMLANDGNYYDGAYSIYTTGSAQDVPIFRITSGNVQTAFFQEDLDEGFTYGGILGVFQGTDGNFYGTTNNGNFGGGGLLQITPQATGTYLGYFEGYGNEGVEADGAIQGSDGNFYAVLKIGGPKQAGTIVRITPSGTTTTLYTFQADSNGVYPGGQLLEASDGNYYGFTNGGNFSQKIYSSTIFQLTPSGSLKTIYTESVPNMVCTGLVEGPDGLLHGGMWNTNATAGEIFTLSFSGTFTTVAPLTFSEYAYMGPLFLAGDGNYYLTSADLLRVSPTGVITDTGVANYGGTLTDDGTGGLAEPYLHFTFDPPLTPSVELQITPNPVATGKPATLSWEAHNGFSLTMQNCFATLFGGTGGGSWSGVRTGSIQDGVYAGSSTITPTVEGYYTYALTCGGRESGFGQLIVFNGAKYSTTTNASATVNAGVVSPIVAVQGETVSLAISVTTTGTLPPSYPTGTVSISVNGVSAGTAAISSGAGSYVLNTNALLPGVYSLVFSYSGDTYNAASQLTLSLTINSNVYLGIDTYPTTQIQVGSPTQIQVYGYLLPSSSNLPTGTITISVNGNEIYSGSLSSGEAFYQNVSTLGYPVAVYQLTATYSGPTGVSPGSASSMVQIIPAATATVLIASPTTVTPPTAVTATATVKRSASRAAGTPTGSVTFYADSTYVLGTATLNSSGVAVLDESTTGVAAGTYAITAKYLGDSSDVASTTATAVSVTVK